jgi:tRNA (guanosine-2'-O-)-methyltransferase
MTPNEKHLLEHLGRFVSDHKKDFIQKVLEGRTRQLTVVMEDIYQSQNASAVIRTSECMGLQDIHIVEQLSKYDINPRVLKGSNKWMTLYRYNDRSINNTKKCFDFLHDRGYDILVADPDERGTPIQEVEIDQVRKVALVFGNELRGVSQYGLENADQRIRIPMYGFTESLNISVSVAICLHTLVSKLHQVQDRAHLTDDEQEMLKLEWYRKIVRRSDLIEREFLRTIQ